MDIAAIASSPEVHIRALIALLYLALGGTIVRRLFPRFSSTAKTLAIAMLMGQILVIVLALELRLPIEYQWIFDLDHEYNIPTALASTQLALVGAVALATAWAAKERPNWRRLYLAALTPLFLYLARDEFFIVHEGIPNWPTYYAAVGAVAALATVAVAASSPRSTWIWHVCLLVGLAMTSTSAIAIDYYRHDGPCVLIEHLNYKRCFLPVLEETLEFFGIWIALVALLGQFSEAAPAPSPHVRRLLLAFPALWILVHPPLIPFLEFQFLAQPTAIEYDGTISVRGYRLDRDAETITLAFFTSAKSRRRHNMLGYSVHLVDQQTGASIASADALIDDHYVWKELELVYRQQIMVKIPPEAQANQALWLVLTLWLEEDGDYLPRTITTSDRQVLGEGQVVLSELALPAETNTSAARKQYVFDNGFALDRVKLPASAIAGASLSINFAWSSDVDGDEDIVQFLHFHHEESGESWGYDQQPLGPRLPTRLWYEDLADTETWDIPLSPDLAPGKYQVYTGLYRLRDSARLAVNNATGKPFTDARVPLGSVIIEKR